MPIAPGDTVMGLSGSYCVDAQHGQGSFGITYTATDLASGARVIVKELRIDKLDDWKALELFEREGTVLASVSHPSIPAFRDLFAHGGPAPLPVRAMSSYDGPVHLSLVLVQAFIEGTTLQQRVDAGERLSASEAEAVLRELLGVLAYLHEHTPPLIHRDVKPGNVILTPSGHPYLVDFGAIQNRLRSADTVGSTIVGTVGYMPLEQIRGDARPASDVYALGVTMVVAMAGRPLSDLPFDDSTGTIATRDALPFATPEPLRGTLDWMIAPLLGQRATSARDVLARLGPVRHEPPPQPSPAMLEPQVRPWAPPFAPSHEPPADSVAPHVPRQDVDADVEAFKATLGARGWWRSRAREKQPSRPGELGVFFYLVTVGLPVAVPVVMLIHWLSQSILGGAKDEFSKRFTCPPGQFTAFERPDLHTPDLVAPPTRTPPPADIAADPARLAMWNANQPKPIADDGATVVELNGCGHHILEACRRGKSHISCGYDKSLGATGASAAPTTAAAPRTSRSAGSATSPASPAESTANLLEGPATIVWKGHLDSSTGDAPPKGAACTLSATVTSRGGRGQEEALTFECQGKMLYDSSVPLAGMSDSMFDLGEELLAGDEPTYRYFLGAKDIGTRAPPRSQIILYTPRGVVDAWRDTTSPFRVHATLDHDSSVRGGKAVRSDAAPLFDRAVFRTARVTAKSGTPPFAASTCRLRIAPVRAYAGNCRVLLTCGGNVVYGADTHGFNQCTLDHGTVKSFVDSSPTPKDGDPELSYDLDSWTATLSDTTKSGATYSVTFSLTETMAASPH